GRLQGKNILITVAAQGIGLAIAKAFMREYAAVFLVDRDAALLAKTAKELQRNGGRLGYLPADITDAGTITTFVAQANEEIGQLNALVNNAAWIPSSGQAIAARPFQPSKELFI
ncbi:SDR family NAD(P)-dependent oxidoreductase, partial [Rhizobium ruizarguesonis]